MSGRSGWGPRSRSARSWVYQELLYEVRPHLVIETGTYAGGSALYLAHVLDILGQGTVVTIDIEQRLRPTHPRITYVHGSRSDPAVAAAMQREHPADRVAVILDADHTEAHVRQELALFAPRVNVGSA
jgi:cephalosporin hydroxylase